MPDSSNPQVPNFQPGVGRLVTDRYDFQAHIDGQSFNHTASQILLSPLITINDVAYSNVQTAVSTLSQLIMPPTIPQASVGSTTSNLGIITLGGDLGGTALAPRVTGLQGYAVSTLPPSVNDILSWNGSNWISTAPSTTFNSATFNGTIGINGTANLNSGATFNMQSGSNFVVQSGSTITSNISSNINIGGFMTITGSLIFGANGSISWLATSNNPGLSQTPSGTDNGTNMFINAQSTDATSKTGGHLILNSGGSGSGILTPSSIIMQSIGNGGTLVVYPFQGSPNSQRLTNGLYECVCTTSGVQTVQFLSLNIPSLSSAFVNIKWTRRNTVALGFVQSGNEASFVVGCSNTGTVTTNTLTTAYSASGFDSSSSILIGTATNTVNLSAVGTGSNTQDWQVIVSINLC